MSPSRRLFVSLLLCVSQKTKSDESRSCCESVAAAEQVRCDDDNERHTTNNALGLVETSLKRSGERDARRASAVAECDKFPQEHRTHMPKLLRVCVYII